MSWAKLDDGHDDGPKVRRALRKGLMGLAAVGLHTLGISYSARRETDGLVDLDWLDEKLHRLGAKERERLMNVVTEVGFFDELPAGTSVELTDTKGFTVTVGPLEEDAHLVHDYLVYNDSSAYLADRRAKDSARKAEGGRNGKPSGVRKESTRNPDGIQTASKSPDQTRPDQDLEPPGPRPAGERKRDLDQWEEKATAFAASVLPHLDRRQAAMEIGMVQMRTGFDAGRDDLIAWLRQNKPQLLDGEKGAAA